jgi:hypothetical protein|tara:strand:+ start:1241 stop:1477 length:237 start_codon:yes stop_codon:yes gene_type:complete
MTHFDQLDSNIADAIDQMANYLIKHRMSTESQRLSDIKETIIDLMEDIGHAPLTITTPCIMGDKMVALTDEQMRAMRV